MVSCSGFVLPMHARLLRLFVTTGTGILYRSCNLEPFFSGSAPRCIDQPKPPPPPLEQHTPHDRVPTPRTISHNMQRQTSTNQLTQTASRYAQPMPRSHPLDTGNMYTTLRGTDGLNGTVKTRYLHNDCVDHDKPDRPPVPRSYQRLTPCKRTHSVFELPRLLAPFSLHAIPVQSCH